MSKENLKDKKDKHQSSTCKVHDCASREQKFGFCQIHHDMYLAGVLRGDGKQPMDYKIKLELYLRHKEASKAA